ncbi:CdaR family transcriptional regulator [uncultured Brevibacillus sp.]|uniref:PucR family transcriptional regulator n=1 Tax=uncultured Brevibacillus sp. TaxID=169970 RepID=UPI002596F18D|nr:helix-turn-helix domain-containing protein [uncultured Brevibacillus sp.]
MKTYQQVEHHVKQFLDRIESKLTQAVPGLVLSWGIGENHAGVKTFHESFIDVRNALDIGSRQKGPGHRSTYSSTSFYRALLTLANNPEIQEITYLTIGSLIKYEEQRGLNLLATLKAYIQNQGNVSQTSRALNLHRHTLLYRLKKIETLTNRSLVDTDDLFLLDLSLRLSSASIAR